MLKKTDYNQNLRQIYMYSFENYELGHTDEAVQIETREDNRLAIFRMTQQCRNTIEIISHNLNPEIYDTTDFIDKVKSLILQNRKAKVRVLTFDVQSIIKRGHRFLELAMDLSSFIEFRIPGDEFKNFNEALFIGDSVGYLHRFNAERFEGTVNFNDHRVSTYLRQHFQEMWDKATPDMNFRKLNI